MKRGDVTWTPELIAELTRLHGLVPELSFTAIARRLKAQGHGVTRNAAIGKARRLGLPKRDVGTVIAANTRRLIEYQASKPKVPPMPRIRLVKGKAPPPPPPVYTEPRGILLIDLEIGVECEWPLNDGGPFRFCGCAVHPGRPYCTDHAKQSYHPVGRR
jgi:GcrA cell cycle regulator